MALYTLGASLNFLGNFLELCSLLEGLTLFLPVCHPFLHEFQSPGLCPQVCTYLYTYMIVRRNRNKNTLSAN